VYGASEGIHVCSSSAKQWGPGRNLVSDRELPRLPNGISGDDLSERAVKQEQRFGAELILTRQVVGILPLRSGGYRVGLDGDEYVESSAIILTIPPAGRLDVANRPCCWLQLNAATECNIMLPLTA
jgi:thioredoxin reductase (NADPH)